VAVSSTEPVQPDTPPEVVAPPARGLRRLVSALAWPDFRLLWGANVISTSGTWMQKVAQNWLVLTLAGPTLSAFYIGLDSFLGDLPILLLTLVGGVIADRHDRRLLLIGSQVIQLTCAFILAALVYFNVIHIWHVLALSFMTGIAQAFGGPAYQSLLPSLVPRRELPNAIALNSIQFNLSRILGPLVAGVTLATLGMAVCFALNGMSFLFVVAALLAMRSATPRGLRGSPAPASASPSPSASASASASAASAAPEARRSILDEMRTGVAYVRARPALVALMVLGFLSTFLGLPLQTLLPVIVRHIFNGDAPEYSKMMAFSGAGAVTGALFFAWLSHHGRLGRTALIMQGLFGAIVIAFSFSRTMWLSEILLFFAGGCMIILASSMISLAQLIAPDDMRGRVMSVYNVAFRGGMPLGNLVAGSLASAASAPMVLTLNGILLICVSVWFLVRGGGVREL
jgi:MFS family permease